MSRILCSLVFSAILAHAQTARPSPGIISQIVAGGDWKTTITLINPERNYILGVTLAFRSAEGPLELPLLISDGDEVTQEWSSQVIRRLGGRRMLRIVIDSARLPALVQGYALVSGELEGSPATGTYRVMGSARFSQRLPDGRVSEAVSPITYESGSSVSVPFDNTAGQATGVALVNRSPDDMPLEVILRDDNGRRTGSRPFLLRGASHAAFDTDAQFGVGKGRGTIEFRGDSPTRVTGLGLRFAPGGTFTSVPVLHSGTPLPLPGSSRVPPQDLTEPGIFGHIASGGGWKTTLTLFNPWPTAEDALFLFVDAQGQALRLPLTVDVRGEHTTLTNATFRRSIPALSTIVIETEAPGATVLQGWLGVMTARGLSGSGVFGQKAPDGKVTEAAVPFVYQTSSAITLPFDGADGAGTGVALMNLADGAVEVSVWSYHDDGSPGPSKVLQLAPNGHRAFEISAELGPVPAAGHLYIAAQTPGARITAVGLRFSPGGGITSLPVFRYGGL